MKIVAGDTVVPHGYCEETRLSWGFVPEMKKLIGKNLIVEKVRGNQVVARYRHGRKFSWHEEDLTLVSKAKYKPVQNINISKLLSAAEGNSCSDLRQAMKDAVWEICGKRRWGRYRNIPFEDVIAFAKQYDGGIEWLITEGFVEEDKSEEIYKPGDVIETPDGSLYVVAFVETNRSEDGSKEYALLSLNGITKFDAWANGSCKLEDIGKKVSAISGKKLPGSIKYVED